MIIFVEPQDSVDTYMLRPFFSSFGKFISFITGPFMAICPFCQLAPVLFTAGQSTFLFAFAKILGPLIFVMLAISLVSFYFTYAKIHHNKLPLIFASLGIVSIVYISYINPFGSVTFPFFGILFLILASGIDFHLKSSIKR